MPTKEDKLQREGEHIESATKRGFTIGKIRGVMVKVLDTDGLRESRLVVNTGAAITMPARTNLKVEGAIDPTKEVRSMRTHHK